jgi:uncharacterized protein
MALIYLRIGYIMIYGLSFGGAEFEALGDAALYWPAHRAILVADLHLEKASSYALNGQMLPPYDSVSTLETLATLANQKDAEKIICLGDNFHDVAGESRLGGKAADLLRQLVRFYDWIWITGNHDPHLAGMWGGTAIPELQMSGIMLRHQSETNFERPEITGHFHPKIRITHRYRTVSRRCYVMTGRKLIMPAFGAFTGGMDAAEAAALAQPSLLKSGTAEALVALPSKIARFPLKITAPCPADGL